MIVALDPVNAYAAGFPDPLIANLYESEKVYDLLPGDKLSEGPKEVSVGMPLEDSDAYSGDVFQSAAYAVLSESGTCWYITDDLRRGIRWAKDTSEDAYLKCYAGRLKLAEDRPDFEQEPWDEPTPPAEDAPVWFPDVKGPDHENPTELDDPELAGPGGSTTTTTLPPGGGSTTTTVPGGGDVCAPSGGWSTGFEDIDAIPTFTGFFSSLPDTIYTSNPGNWVSWYDDSLPGTTPFQVATTSPHSGSKHLESTGTSAVYLFPTWGCAPTHPSWASTVGWPLSLVLPAGKTLTIEGSLGLHVSLDGAGTSRGDILVLPYAFAMDDLELIPGVTAEGSETDWSPANGSYKSFQVEVGGLDEDVFVVVLVQLGSYGSEGPANVTEVVMRVDDFEMTITDGAPGGDDGGSGDSGDNPFACDVVHYDTNLIMSPNFEAGGVYGDDGVIPTPSTIPNGEWGWWYEDFGAASDLTVESINPNLGLNHLRFTTDGGYVYTSYAGGVYCGSVAFNTTNLFGAPPSFRVNPGDTVTVTMQVDVNADPGWFWGTYVHFFGEDIPDVPLSTLGLEGLSDPGSGYTEVQYSVVAPSGAHWAQISIEQFGAPAVMDIDDISVVITAP